MNVTITVKPTSNASGRPQRVAKALGKQRTVSVDLSKSDDYNAGAAAGELAKALGLTADSAERCIATRGDRGVYKFTFRD